MHGNSRPGPWESLPGCHGNPCPDSMAYAKFDELAGLRREFGEARPQPSAL